MLGLKARCLHFSLGGSLEGYGNPCGPRAPYYPECLELLVTNHRKPSERLFNSGLFDFPPPIFFLKG